MQNARGIGGDGPPRPSVLNMIVMAAPPPKGDSPNRICHFDLTCYRLVYWSPLLYFVKQTVLRPTTLDILLTIRTTLHAMTDDEMR